MKGKATTSRNENQLERENGDLVSSGRVNLIAIERKSERQGLKYS